MSIRRLLTLCVIGLSVAAVLLALGAFFPGLVRNVSAQCADGATVVYLPQIENASSGTDTPPDTPPLVAPFRIAVIGDFGMNNGPEAEVADLVASWAPDVVVTTGDNNYPSGAAETLDANVGQFYHEFISPYVGSYGDGATTNRFFPVLGNHDWYAATGAPALPYPYLDYFDLPSGPGQERYYDVVLGPVHLFALDSDPNEPDGITSTSFQAGWLRTGLAASTAPWKLVFLHHPPYSSALVHGSTPDLQWPFGAWGATAVLAGHDHTYERLVVDGVPYFVNGIGGAALYGMGTPLPGSQVRFNADYGAMLIEATAATITFRLFDRTGIECDSYTLAAQPAPVTLPTVRPQSVPR